MAEHEVGGVIVVRHNNNSFSNNNNYSNTVIGIKSPKLNDNTPGQTYFSYNQRPKLPKARLTD